MPTFSPGAEFQKLCAGQPDVKLPLLLLEFAADRYPQLDAVGCLMELNRLGESARALVGRHHDVDRPLDRRETREALAMVSHYLYEQEGFYGNSTDYYDPRNSYLNEVLDRRTGLPILLGSVYMAVAHCAGLPIYGCSTPGHFVLGCDCLDGRVFIEPFVRGEVLSRSAVRRRIEELSGQKDWPDELLLPATTHQVAQRVLRNLKAAYARLEDWPHALPVQERLVCLLPKVPEERRDLGLILLRTGQPWPALELLERYSRDCPDASGTIAPFVRAARRLGAEMN